MIRHSKVIEDGGGIVEIRLWRVDRTPVRPHGLKYSLVYIVNGARVIGYDNAEGKGDHRHYGKMTERYGFKGLRKLADDFYGDIEKYGKGLL